MGYRWSRTRSGAPDAAPGYAPQDILRIAGSIDHASKHIVAETIVAAARARSLDLQLPTSSRESPGEGIEGRVGGHDVIVGGMNFAQSKCAGSFPQATRPRAPGDVIVAVAIDGCPAGHSG